MGRGSYTANDWAVLKNSKKLTGFQEAEKIYTSRIAQSKYDVLNISMRESRDSEDSPKSTPIIIGFDVTGSMNYLAKELAVNGVNRALTALLDEKPVPNPQVMCAAVGDCKSDKSPLQVTQFESDIRIIKQLLDLYLEGGGGGNDGESYNLLWYFAARHTQHDCHSVRGKKGFLFTIGDDKCHSQLMPAEIYRVFGDRVDYPLSNEALLSEVQKTYHVVHIHIQKGGSNDDKILYDWMRFLSGYTTYINIKDIGCIAQLIAAIISVISGVPANKALKSGDQFIAEKIAPSLAMIKQEETTNRIKNKTIITF